ncbi:RNA-binding protein [bacterium]|nr:RNA-binding protein [bacterium]
MNNRLFVANLAWAVTADELKRAFASAGVVRDAFVPVAPDGRSRGHGFVEMATAEEAARAIEELAGLELHGRPIRIEYRNERPERNRERAGHARPGMRRFA